MDNRVVKTGNLEFEPIKRDDLERVSVVAQSVDNQ
jgi:hypothetical protein